MKGLVVGLVKGLVVALVEGLVVGPADGLVVGLVEGLGGGLMEDLVEGLTEGLELVVLLGHAPFPYGVALKLSAVFSMALRQAGKRQKCPF